MDAATLQSRIYTGYSKAALRIGLDTDLYRPGTASHPISGINKLRTFPASFNAEDMKYGKPNKYGHPIWYGIFDGALTQSGDYLVRVSDGQTYYIGGQQQLLPIICIECNRSIRITRENSSSAVGALPYSGNQPANETDVLGAPNAMWPASILFGGRIQQSMNLPASVREAGWQILLPPSVPITIMAGDIATDDLGRRYAIEGAESTDLGWRINAQEAHS